MAPPTVWAPDAADQYTAPFLKAAAHPPAGGVAQSSAETDAPSQPAAPLRAAYLAWIGESGAGAVSVAVGAAAGSVGAALAGGAPVGAALAVPAGAGAGSVGGGVAEGDAVAAALGASADVGAGLGEPVGEGAGPA
jgi:hypothetical protein